MKTKRTTRMKTKMHQMWSRHSLKERMLDDQFRVLRMSQNRSLKADVSNQKKEWSTSIISQRRQNREWIIYHWENHINDQTSHKRHWINRINWINSIIIFSKLSKWSHNSKKSRFWDHWSHLLQSIRIYFVHFQNFICEIDTREKFTAKNTESIQMKLIDD
jgi:hypothetical protein